MFSCELTRITGLAPSFCADGLTPGYDINVLPEGAPFGEAPWDLGR